MINRLKYYVLQLGDPTLTLTHLPRATPGLGSSQPVDQPLQLGEEATAVQKVVPDATHDAVVVCMNRGSGGGRVGPCTRDQNGGHA